MSDLAQNINNIINSPNNELGKLVNRVNQLKLMGELIQNLLPDHLKKHCVVANFSNQRLILATSNGTWATQLRYHSSELLQKLRQIKDYAAIGQIRIIVDPSRQPFKKIEAAPALNLSQHTRELFGSLAGGATDDELRRALLKLAGE